MATISLTGADTIKLNQRLLTDFPDGDVAKLTYEADNVTMAVGKNGNTIIVANESGRKAKLELRVMRGSKDDEYLNSQQTLQNTNLPATVLASGLIAKTIGDGSGNLTFDQYSLVAGVFTKIPEVTSNVQGEKEQAVTVYMMEFSGAVRSLS